jgi:putative SOS response-associated peptidase YedK
MCGRYVVAYDPQTLVSGFSLSQVVPFPRRYNAAPMSEVPVVFETREGERVAELMRWGLLPHWARDATLAAKLNNARGETVAEKPSFRQALRRRRCLLPASGYFEWQTMPGPAGKPVKQPWYITPAPALRPADQPNGEAFFAMAGLFEAWRPPGSAEEAPWLLTCCVITTEANADLAPIHDRMPVMLRPDQWASWLARGQQDPAGFQPWLQPAPLGTTQAWPVSRAVNQGRAEGEALIQPISIPPTEGDPHVQRLVD